MGAKFYAVKELFVKAKNVPGALNEIAVALGNKGINIDSISAYATDSNAFFRILTVDAVTAQKALSSLPSVQNVSVEDILVLKMENTAGQLAKITEKLSKKGVDLESVYLIGREKNITEVALKPIASHFEKAKNALSE